MEVTAGKQLEPTARNVFAHRTFAMVWAGAFVSNIGNWMENSAQNWAVVHALKDDPVRQGFMSEVLNFADFAPALLLVLIAGVITDRVNLKRYLLTLQLLACGLGAGLAVLAFLGWASPWVVIWFTFAEGIIWALNGPPWQTVVPRLVPRELLPRAIAMNAAQFNLARLIGPFVAGLLIVRYGVPVAFAINAASFIVVLYALAKLPPTPKRSVTPPPILQDLRAGVHFVWTHNGLRRLSIMLVCYSFFSAPLQGLLAVYVQTVLHGNANLYGNLLGCLGFGALTGALTVGYVPSY